MRLRSERLVPSARIPADGGIEAQRVIDLIGIASCDSFTDFENVGIVLLTFRVRLPATDRGVLFGYAWQAGGRTEDPEPEQGQGAVWMRVYGSVKRRCCLIANHASSVKPVACCLLYFAQSGPHLRNGAGDDDALGLREGQPMNAGPSNERIGEIEYQRR